MKPTNYEDCKILAKKIGTTSEEIAKAFGIMPDSDLFSTILTSAIENQDLVQMWKVHNYSPIGSKYRLESILAIESCCKALLIYAIENKDSVQMWKVQNYSPEGSTVKSDSLYAILILARENQDLIQMWEVYKHSPWNSNTKADSLFAIETYWDKN